MVQTATPDASNSTPKTAIAAETASKTPKATIAAETAASKTTKAASNSTS